MIFSPNILILILYVPYHFSGYSMLFNDSTMSIFFNLKYITQFTNNENPIVNKKAVDITRKINASSKHRRIHFHCLNYEQVQNLPNITPTKAPISVSRIFSRNTYSATSTS